MCLDTLHSLIYSYIVIDSFSYILSFTSLRLSCTTSTCSLAGDTQVRLHCKDLNDCAGKMPTVVSPQLYRSRFLEAMDQYFLHVPDQWNGLGRGRLRSYSSNFQSVGQEGR